MRKTVQNGLRAAAMLLAFGALASAANCSLSFMHDPCARDGYSVVETEPVVKGHHNWMEVAHHYPWEIRRTHYRHGHKGKNIVRARSSVARVGS